MSVPLTNIRRAGGAPRRAMRLVVAHDSDTSRDLYERAKYKDPAYHDPIRDDRWPGLAAFALDAKAQSLRPLLLRSNAPSEIEQEALLIFGEAVSNYYKHTNAPFLRVYCSLRSSGKERTLTMGFTYHTPPFNTEPPVNDLYAESGRGIYLMREIADRARFRFEDGALQLTLAKRWEAR